MSDLPEAMHHPARQPPERFPCLVDLWAVMELDQVWATDITYISGRRVFLWVGLDR